MTDLAVPGTDDRTDDTSRPAVVLGVHGLVDEHWAAKVRATILDSPLAGAVIDLTDAILVTRRPLQDALDAVVHAVGDPGRVAIVCPRLSALMLLQRWGVLGQVAIHPTLDDAGATVVG